MREEEIPWLHTPSFSISDQPPHAGKQPALGCRHRLGCCRIAHPVHTAGGLVFKPVLKDCFWCFSTALKPGGMAEKQQKASKGCLGLLPRQQQQLQAPPAHGTARRGTSVWTTGTHLGGNFSQGLQPGHFLQSLFYYTGHSAQTSSSPLSRSLLHGHHPQQTLRSTCTHRTPPALLCKCDYKSMSPNLSPPSEDLPPIQPLWGSAEPHTLHTLPCWTASTS